jgi:hypothetical protein
MQTLKTGLSDVVGSAVLSSRTSVMMERLFLSVQARLSSKVQQRLRRNCVFMLSLMNVNVMTSGYK